MLDTATKRRIDTARDILVGKVPDPKSQVEQITIALIYKFMDDMDAEAEELGGKRKFFTGEYAQFGWAKLMSPALGGEDRIRLYSDGISTMPKNPGIPMLFRDIFKNAYLPYRDPETLNAFLKIIDEFTYDHSERLGDAFEYLLSVLGSQGDAGQFRTPRHIIDFMVEVVQPQKDDVILDPACGTAGFLISAFKHILRSNTSSPSPSGRGAGVRAGDLLTPDDRGKLARNLKGYDISPDMVRLSLVNLYLHGFTDPHVYEYDTLTDQARWNEYADVILANPPFMSPKGGIKPHNRFSIQAKRSEVLFVDYMAEHLTPTGRAAIIVPEGIIFQGQTAYKQLRRLLVESCLVAVISLPAGCFNPYSGVKTSILILDKTLAAKSDSIGFFKVENDGFSLGAQRRPIDKNDLPQVQADLTTYLDALRSGSPVEALAKTGQIVPKEKLAANGEYNLSGERYRKGAATNLKWPMIALGTIARLINGRAYKQEELLTEGPIPVLRVGNFFSNRGWYYSDLELEPDKYCNPGDLLFAWSASFGPRIWDGPRAIYHYHIWKVEPTEAVDKMFLFHLLASEAEKIKSEGNGIAMVHATKGGMEQRKFPLPPLEVQKEIVAEIEGYQKVIDGARAVLDHYRPHIPIHPDWPLVELGEVCEEFQYGSSLKSSDIGDVVCLRMGNIQKGEIDWTDLKFAPPEEDLDKYLLSPNDVLFNRTNSAVHVGKTGIYRGGRPAVFAGYLIRIHYQKDKLMGQYLNYCLNTKEAKEFCLRVKTDGINQSNINAKVLGTFQIPLPPLATQQAIVAEIEAEQALVAANRELITRFEKKIQATLARIWGEPTEGDAVPA